MLRVGKTATPPTAATVVVPDRLPPAGLLPIATVTLPAKPSALLPRLSRAVTSSWGVMAVPAVAGLGCTVKASWIADPGMMPKGALVSVSPAAVAASVYPVPLLLILSVAKVATPLIAATVVVPERTPAPGFAAIATVTVPVKPVTVLPATSRAVTSTAGAMAAPAAAVVGCWRKVRRTAVAGMMSNGPLATPVKPAAVAESRYPLPAWSMLSVENVATPATAATVVVPDNVPPAGLVAIATVMLPAKPVAVFPSASRAVTCTAGLIVAPAVVVPGGTVNASWLAAPGTMLKATLVVPERPGVVAERV